MASDGTGFELKAEPNTSTKSTRLLIAVTAIGLVLGAAGFALPHVVGPRDELAGERQAALTRASDFAVTYNTFTLKNKADYLRRVKPLMTPSFYKEFSTITNLFYTVAKDKSQGSGDVRVLASAVDSIDKDSASVLVALDTRVRSSGSKESADRQFRWQVSMRKVGSQWLVNQFSVVPPVEATLDDGPTPKKGGAQ